MSQNQRADLDKDPQAVQRMFSFVAPRYDLVNAIASLGQERWWRSETVEALAPQAGEVILDLAAGTGTSSFPIARSGATVVSADLTEAMVALGKRRRPRHPFVVGDALKLPFGDGVFDAATISFGLRNVADTPAALAELKRVVRPGGALVICEFSTPTSWLMRFAHRQWLHYGLPLISRLVSGNPPAYAYLGESILDWPDQRGLARQLEATGWQNIQWRNLTGGVVALHRAVRP